MLGKQLNGQLAGAAYGDDDQMDSNYPVLRLLSSAGNTYYCKTSNWSTTGVATGTTPETVNFTLNPAMPAGSHTAIVSGAGIQGIPVAVTITQAQVSGQ